MPERQAVTQSHLCLLQTVTGLVTKCNSPCYKLSQLFSTVEGDYPLLLKVPYFWVECTIFCRDNEWLMNGWRPPFIAGNPLYIDVSGDLMNG